MFRFLFFNCFPDDPDLPLQSITTKSGSFSCYSLCFFIQKHRCHRTAGSRISDSHFSGRQDGITGLFLFFHLTDADHSCLQHLFPGHCRSFGQIGCAVRHLISRFCDRSNITYHSDINREDINICYLSHNTGTRLPFGEIIRHSRRHILPGLCDSLFYHSIIGTHDNKALLFQFIVICSQDPRNLNHCFLQLPQTEQWLCNAHPPLLCKIHALFIQRPNLHFYLFQLFLFCFYFLLHSFRLLWHSFTNLTANSGFEPQ